MIAARTHADGRVLRRAVTFTRVGVVSEDEKRARRWTIALSGEAVACRGVCLGLARRMNGGLRRYGKGSHQLEYPDPIEWISRQAQVAIWVRAEARMQYM